MFGNLFGVLALHQSGRLVKVSLLLSWIMKGCKDPSKGVNLAFLLPIVHFMLEMHEKGFAHVKYNDNF